VIQSLGVTGYMSLPLVARNQTLGVLTLLVSEPGRRFHQADVSLAEELARRAAHALDNARLYQEAQAAIQMRDAFLSIASHELKTPLTTLQGYAELLLRRRQSHDERTQRALEIVAEQARRLNKMIESLLDISRLEEGQLNIDRAPFDLGALVRRLVDELRPTLTLHRPVLDAPEESLLIEGDALRLEQVLHNLIHNAVKYSPEGGTITVRLAKQGPWARISVTDQGIGIADSAIPHLFDRFYRAESVESRRIGGVGLGLFVVREIVLLHGGHVEVTSREGSGSTFTVLLPLPGAQVGESQAA
jgi:signal transduction histidine kinase